MADGQKQDLLLISLMAENDFKPKLTGRNILAIE